MHGCGRIRPTAAANVDHENGEICLFCQQRCVRSTEDRWRIDQYNLSQLVQLVQYLGEPVNIQGGVRGEYGPTRGDHAQSFDPRVVQGVLDGRLASQYLLEPGPARDAGPDVHRRVGVG